MFTRFSLFSFVVVLSFSLFGCEKSGSGGVGTDKDPVEGDCGNGVVDDGELCDRAIARGEDGYCPRTADQCPGAASGFFEHALEGSFETCSVKCVSELSNNINAYRMTEIDLLQPALEIDLDEDGDCEDSDQSMRRTNAALEALVESRRISMLLLTTPFPADEDEFELRIISANCRERPGMVDRCDISENDRQLGLMTSATKQDDGVCFGADPGEFPEGIEEVDAAVVNDVAPSCFASDVITDRFFTIYDGTFEVTQTVLSATIEDDTRRLSGYVHGYLSAEDARSLHFGQDVPTYTDEERDVLSRFFGVQVSSILPGGEGSCGGEDENRQGWWITFSFTAEPFAPGTLQ